MVVAYIVAAASQIWPECFPAIVVRKSLSAATVLAVSLSIFTQIYKEREKRALRSESERAGQQFPEL